MGGSAGQVKHLASEARSVVHRRPPERVRLQRRSTGSKAHLISGAIGKNCLSQQSAWSVCWRCWFLLIREGEMQKKMQKGV